MRTDEAMEYGVEVPGRGYIGWHGDLRADLEMGLNSFDEAVEILNSGRKRYESMGCPEIAETLRIVSRLVTVTRGAWVADKVEASAAPVDEKLHPRLAFYSTVTADEEEDVD